MAPTLKLQAVAVDDIDLRIGPGEVPTTGPMGLFTITQTYTQSCTCVTCTAGNCTGIQSTFLGLCATVNGCN